MANHAIQKVCQEGVGYATVDLVGVRHLLAAAVPRRGHSIDQQADDALRTLAAAIGGEGFGGGIVQQAVFVADASQIEPCRRIISDFYGNQLPATSYIPQPPCEGKLLWIEALGVAGGQDEVEIERHSEQLVVARHNGIAWVHAAQVVPQPAADSVYDAATSVFGQMDSLLGSVGLGFDRVVRTWLYLGGIGQREGGVDRYQQLNRARADFYRPICFLSGDLRSRPCSVDTLGATAGSSSSVGNTVGQANRGTRDRPAYPASTAIGTAGQGLILSTIALISSRKDVVAVPLENPRQTAPYAYAAASGRESPRFSRGLALSFGTEATIFISGTASIIGAETRHAGNAAAQTHETLDNIAALVSEENLCRHRLPGLGASLESLGTVRVYLKRPQDYPLVRAVCRERLGELPAIYALADVCRDELLVEIEGIAFSRRTPLPPRAGRDAEVAQADA